MLKAGTMTLTARTLNMAVEVAAVVAQRTQTPLAMVATPFSERVEAQEVVVRVKMAEKAVPGEHML